ncbi:MAG: phosphoribosylamine--glycine ligase [Clostridia bacterium]|nr:phosphoribosylamine--glycine ligase [Clostridia bacterium]
MKILIVGGGGREHAIAWKISQNPNVTKIWCAPGNGGIARIAECVNIKATDIEGMVKFAKEVKPDLVMVAPDDPLVMGLVDALEAEGIRAFGPRANAAIIEGSKSFAKELMINCGVPTAKYAVFTDADEATQYVKEQGAPIVIKADGLALGKGVTVAKTEDEAIAAIRDAILDKAFGDAGARVVIEECLEGPEVSVLCFTDGKTICPMPSAQDHKRAYDHDEGPNTGGMGAFSPSRIYNDELASVCMEKIFRPTIDGMAKMGRPFKGVLYFGLMITKDGPKVIEYNARFGDPETQAVLPRLKTDLVEIMNAIIDEKLDEINIEWKDDAACCVVLASGGYPKAYTSGYTITGVEVAEEMKDVIVFHAGTKIKECCGMLQTNGGRVLGVTGLGATLDDAIKCAYAATEKIDFTDLHKRTDIGIK